MSRSCKECVHHNPDFLDKVCLHCSWPEFAGEPSNFKPKPITNADRIRAMTDEELAEFLRPVKCVDCHLLDCGVEEIGVKKTCEERILDWLKEEAEE